MPTLSLGHSALLTDLATCLNWYRMASPGLYCCLHVSVELGEHRLLTPGVVLMVNHGRLKTAKPEPDYERFRGPPNFIADVFPSPDDPEYQRRRSWFAEAGVSEYLAVFDTGPLSWRWHARTVPEFGDLAADADGVLRSQALAGLWIPTKALCERDWWAIMAAITRGVTRRGHHEFMEAIWNPGNSATSIT